MILNVLKLYPKKLNTLKVKKHRLEMGFLSSQLLVLKDNYIYAGKTQILMCKVITAFAETDTLLIVCGCKMRLHSDSAMTPTEVLTFLYVGGHHVV